MLLTVTLTRGYKAPDGRLVLNTSLAEPTEASSI